MEIQESQYQNALRQAKSADEALQQVLACLKRHENADRIRRVIEDVETCLKKVKRELRLA